MDIYTDASPDGTLAILPIGELPRIFRSRETNMAVLEYEALIRALDIFGPQCTYFCDNVKALHKARNHYPTYNIRRVLGKANPADPYTRAFGKVRRNRRI